MGRLRVPVGPRVVAALLLVVLLATFVAAGAALPLIPHAVLEGGGGAAFVPVTTSIYFLASLGGRLIGGVLADRLGRRPVVAAGLVLAAGAGLLYLADGGPALIGLSRGVHGLATATAFTAASAWVVDVVPSSGRLFGLLGACAWSGYALGAILAPWLVTLAAAGVVVIAVAAVAVAIVLVVPRLPTLGDPAGQRGDDEASGRRRLAPIVVTALLPAALFGMSNVGYGVLQAYLPLLGPPGRGAQGLAAFGVVVLAARLLGGAIPERWGVRRSLWTAALLTAATIPVLPLVADLPALYFPALAVAGFAYSLAWPVMASWTVQRASPRVRASALATLNAGNDVLIAVSLLAIGGVVGLAGTSAAAFVAPAVLVTLMVAILEVDRRRAVGRRPAAAAAAAAADYGRVVPRNE